MGNRIRELRKRAGFTLQQLADKTGTTNQQISMLERSTRRLSVEWMERIAPALGVMPTELMAVTDAPQRIRLIGEVRAGLWGEPLETNDHDGEWISIPIPEVYLRLRAYAVRVAGPSMDRVYPDGTILICCHMEELQEEPVSGKRYIIENRDPHGRVETTVKEFARSEDGRPWAWPRSSHPDYQQPIPLDKGQRGHSIALKARVVFALRPE